MANNLPHPFGATAKKYRALRRKLPVIISNMALNEFIDNFDRQGIREASGVQKWKKRKRFKNKRDQSRKTLIKSGRLRRSLKAKPDFNTARVVSNVPYARIHNEGETIKGNVKVKQHQRQGSTVREHTRNVNITIPERPFMVSTKPLLDDMEKRVFDDLEEIFIKS